MINEVLFLEPRGERQPATAIKQQSKLQRLPVVGSQSAGLIELAVKEKQNHLDYLDV